MLFQAMSMPYRVGALISQRRSAARLTRPSPPLHGGCVKPLIGSLAISIGRRRKASDLRSGAAAAPAHIRNSTSNDGAGPRLGAVQLQKSVAGRRALSDIDRDCKQSVSGHLREFCARIVQKCRASAVDDGTSKSQN